MALHPQCSDKLVFPFCQRLEMLLKVDAALPQSPAAASVSVMAVALQFGNKVTSLFEILNYTWKFLCYFIFNTL